VREENGQMFWGRVSDDLVPVNVVCIQDTPSTVYQITAYNSLVKKILDIRLVQPGTLRLVTLAASSGKHNATVWRLSVRPSVCLCVLSAYSARLTRRQHATRPAYISARQ